MTSTTTAPHRSAARTARQVATALRAGLTRWQIAGTTTRVAQLQLALKHLAADPTHPRIDYLRLQTELAEQQTELARLLLRQRWEELDARAAEAAQP